MKFPNYKMLRKISYMLHVCIIFSSMWKLDENHDKI